MARCATATATSTGRVGRTRTATPEATPTTAAMANNVGITPCPACGPTAAAWISPAPIAAEATETRSTSRPDVTAVSASGPFGRVRSIVVRSPADGVPPGTPAE